MYTLWCRYAYKYFLYLNKTIANNAGYTAIETTNVNIKLRHIRGECDIPTSFCFQQIQCKKI